MAMNPIGLSREQCVEALNVYSAQIDAIIESIINQDAKHALDTFRALKQRVYEDGDVRARIVTPNKMSTVEEALFLPAVLQIRLDLALIEEGAIRNWPLNLLAAQRTIEEFVAELVL